MEGLGILGIVGNSLGIYGYDGYYGYFIFTQYTHLTQYTQYTQIYPRGTCTLSHHIKQKTDDFLSHLLNPIKVSRDTGIRTAKPKSRYLIKKSARRSLSNKSL